MTPGSAPVVPPVVRGWPCRRGGATDPIRSGFSLVAGGTGGNGGCDSEITGDVAAGPSGAGIRDGAGVRGEAKWRKSWNGVQFYFEI